jgi:hypothetical protein
MKSAWVAEFVKTASLATVALPAWIAAPDPHPMLGAVIRTGPFKTANPTTRPPGGDDDVTTGSVEATVRPGAAAPAARMTMLVMLSTAMAIPKGSAAARPTWAVPLVPVQ